MSSSGSTFWTRCGAKLKSFGAMLWRALKANPVMALLYAPLLVGVSVQWIQIRAARQDAREARAQATNSERLTKTLESGKSLDLALASYFQSVADLGLAAHSIQARGTYTVTPLPVAQSQVVTARLDARKALMQHASDVQTLRPSVDPVSSNAYLGELARISDTIEGQAKAENSGAYIIALSRLVVARNAMVDAGTRKNG